MEDVQEIARWLQNYLTEASVVTDKAATQNAKHTPTGQRTVKLPDYAARRRMIFGDKTLPNMVLMDREEDRW